MLTGFTRFWLETLAACRPHHLDYVVDDDGVPDGHADHVAALRRRAMIVYKAEVLPVACVVRGYLYGSSFAEYAAGGGPTTEHLPEGLLKASTLDEPIFTPATKAESGHEEKLTESEAREVVGDGPFEELNGRSEGVQQKGDQ